MINRLGFAAGYAYEWLNGKRYALAGWVERKLS